MIQATPLNTTTSIDESQYQLTGTSQYFFPSQMVTERALAIGPTDITLVNSSSSLSTTVHDSRAPGAMSDELEPPPLQKAFKSAAVKDGS